MNAINLFKQNGLLDRHDCDAIRRAMDDGEAEDAEILEGGIQRERGVRRAALIEPPLDVVNMVEAVFERHRQGIGAALAMTLAEREGAGFVRYPTGGFYRPHRDCGDDPAWPPAARRAVAHLLVLNTSRDSGLAGEFDGGRLRLFIGGEVVEVVPEAGTLVAFPADVLHEVTEVRGGRRDTVVDWFYR